ncbi:MAG: zinc-binding dehydrogenase [Oscillospiraceae bacterium]|nr:zinc-binding dehydrogenase [Oscillospiraceae bacterium]
MKGLAVDAGGALSVVELDMPETGEYQALVRTVACGVCNGTDAKLIHGEFKNFHDYPAVLGHEAVGEVVRIGSKVRNFKVGDRVLLPFLEQENRGYHSGWGGFAQYGVVGDYRAMPDGMDYPEAYRAQSVVPPDLDPVKAVMLVTFREVLSAIRRFGLRAGEPVLVYGAGPVGLCFIRFCKLLGLGPVIAAEVDGEKLEEAKKLGADYAFDSLRCDVAAEVRRMFPAGIDNIIDAAGVNALIRQAMEIVKYNGKICCYGISAKTSMTLDWTRAPYNWSLLFVQWPSKTEEGEADEQIFAWLRSGELCFDDYISDIVPFEQVLDVFDTVLAGRARKKVIVRY